MRELSCPIRRFQFSPDSVSITLAEMCTNAAFMRVFHRLYSTLSNICTSHPCLGAPTGGLLAKLPGMAADDRYRAHWALVETALGVVSAVPAAAGGHPGRALHGDVCVSTDRESARDVSHVSGHAAGDVCDL